MRYDLAIIGAGPAGLSAALNAKIRNKSVIIFGKDSPKLTKTESIKNYLGFRDIRGSELNKRFKDSLKDYEINFSNDRIQTVYAMGDYHALMLKSGEMVESTAVIVATGMDQTKDLAGEEEFFAKGVSYCATCDAALYKGKEVVLIGYNEESVEEANFTAEIVDKLSFVNMYKDDIDLDPSINLIEGEVPLGFTGDDRAKVLEFKSGKKIEADGFFIIKDSSKAQRLVPSLKMKDNHIDVDSNMATNIAGLFAAGDVTGSPYQIMKAVGQGQIASLEAVRYITKIKSK
ncbi:NAD(P)/FAD-dependent oxidoreductase [Anaerococcus marasmi]|uniref:NAD(P)/FAD-dependent oxidoreductase n=1 Tax=Anaerococcus marasmi TaxID=2057797 RepID=UPI000CFA0628|nr:NAD(P)/FAD-dependent oxidoreductase [Anaerococcus marasmi]